MRRDNKAIADELFKPTGPLGAFGTKIKLAYLFRIIHPDIYKDFVIVSKIRNAFAHDLTITSFEDQQIAAWIKNMNTYSLVKKMGEEASERMRAGTSRGTVDFVASKFLLSMGSAYRQCLRLLIHNVIDHENSFKLTEKPLNDEAEPRSSPGTP